MNKTELFAMFTLSVFSALTAVSARLGYFLFQIDVNIPEDAGAATHWHRKRRWLAISEFMALPSFAIISVAVTVYFSLPIVFSVLISMVLGALGFGFFLHGLQWVIKNKLGMPQ